MHSTLNANIPQHIYGHVCSEILCGMNPDKVGQFEECAIFGVTSIPARAWHFQIMCRSGAQWARIPIHMLRWQRQMMPEHPLCDVQCWDCHGWDFSVIQYDFLRDMACTFKAAASGTIIPAQYWFTADHTDNGYSQDPQQHKCYHFLKLTDGSGQIAAMPNNRIYWQDDSFVNASLPKEYQVMSPMTWHAEQGHSPADTAFTVELGAWR